MRSAIPALTLRNRGVRTKALRFYFTGIPSDSTTTTEKRLRAAQEDTNSAHVVHSLLAQAVLTQKEKCELYAAISAIIRSENASTATPIADSECVNGPDL